MDRLFAFCAWLFAGACPVQSRPVLDMSLVHLVACGEGGGSGVLIGEGRLVGVMDGSDAMAVPHRPLAAALFRPQSQTELCR